MLKKFLKRIDKPNLTASLIMISGMLLPFFFSEKPNRIVSPTPLSLKEISGQYFFLLFIPAALIAFKPVSGRKRIYINILKTAGVSFCLYFTLYYAGETALNIIKNNQISRTGPSTGFWIFCAGIYFFYINISSRAQKLSPRLIYTFILILPFFCFLYSGVFQSFSIAREFDANSSRFYAETINHLLISYGSVSGAVLFGVPAGYFSFKNKSSGKKIFYVLSIIQTIPGIALFGILMVPLAFLAKYFPFAEAAGISGTGTAPAVCALFLYSLLPIVKNTYEAFEDIDFSVTEAGRGMGMKNHEILLKIELPMSIPVILNGIRTSLVQSVGNTAVAALIGAGGLGVFIFQGLGQAATDLILLGAVPVIIIAAFTDKLMEILKTILAPKGLKNDRA
jgi:osmoprotectant transport system permease protein